MLVNSAVAVDGAGAPTHVLMIGGKCYTGVPVAEADGDTAAIWLDEVRRAVLYGFSFSSEAFEIEDVAPAHFAPFAPVVMTQLTAPGATDPIEVRSFNRVSAQILLASVDFYVIVRLEGSHDGTLWFPLALEPTAVTGLTITGAEATITADGPYYIVSTEIATKYARFNFVSEYSSTAATLDVQMKAKT